MDINGRGVFNLVLERKKVKIRKDSEIYSRKLGYIPRMSSVYLIYEEPLDGSSPINVYVGKTDTSLSKRFNGHISEIKRMVKGKKHWTVKYMWMKQAIRGKNRLKMELLSSVPKDVVYNVEKEWIMYFRLNGYNTFNKSNKKYYKNNYEDIIYK
ncbi:hypothetical protein KAU11_10510 [Candidatus Babeliales bacterium]|nr:hypothetical protein [Candidatus Babeliales bacterium]